jgi:hypothetical protein
VVIGRACYVICDRCGNPAEVVTGGAKEARAVASETARYRREDGQDLCGDCRDKDAGTKLCNVCDKPTSDFRQHYPWTRCDSTDDQQEG